jgi:Protein of unknown function (DUF1566)
VQRCVPFHLFDRKSSPMNIKHVLASLLLPIALWANAAPFSISADGQEVTDAKTGLIWRRCAEGMTASVSGCTGTAGTFSAIDALTLASTQASSTGVAWRLPNVKELSSIADKSRINPAIDTAAFPATPPSYFWSSSPWVVLAGNVWAVFFGDGIIRGRPGYGEGYIFSVRLVRTGQ